MATFALSFLLLFAVGCQWHQSTVQNNPLLKTRRTTPGDPLLASIQADAWERPLPPAPPPEK